ncbi:hypothetical protein SAMD00019534_126070 [Acytostelium subglobosum LB1]|uniref:hypothetical protein n=1 Tax=Acytostelium subglobosum LB1 TaxID=1410327 RepID=UPI0006451600|nr:hypothetical protein SAMD00019534_126070 [Acytostelium subglobosum LB1]GAM29431.1 hypothetical protein SAMD00019534_126070 [Acytostelium subglobosum LB1]|eukprot:XP_012747622.1 hypothetical protein SAMD00019534_126070 [Acytostelium subglobosum LB1]
MISLGIDKEGEEPQFKRYYGLTMKHIQSDDMLNGILKRKHGGSMARMLAYLFPDYQWLPWLFKHAPKGLYDDPQTVREMLRWYANEQLLRPHDFFSFSPFHFARMGLNIDFIQYRRHLIETFPEVEWCPWMFYKKPSWIWHSASMRQYFAEWTLRTFDITKSEFCFLDLQRNNVFYSTTLYSQLGPTHYDVARAIYPDEKWNEAEFDIKAIKISGVIDLVEFEMNADPSKNSGDYFSDVNIPE